MRRYSALLEKNPHLKGKDIETTRQACAKFRHMPVSVMNFVEGHPLHRRQARQTRAPYRHLLHPRQGHRLHPGGHGDQLHKLVDVTIAYPGGVPSYWDFMCGRVKDQGSGPLSADRTQSGGDYFNDPEFQQRVSTVVERDLARERTRPWISCWRTRRSKTLMPNLLPGPLVLFISAGLTILFTALCQPDPAGFPGQTAAARAGLWSPCSRLNNRFMGLWLGCNALVIRLTTRIDWQIEDNTRLRKDGWYLIISNHLSWTDIVVLGHLFRNRLPVPKFFMKHELIYIPLLGLACWGLDMPFMRRYSREFLLRNPASAGQGYRDHPQRLREVSPHSHHRHQLRGGTRFTDQKRDASRSRYRHLMPPRRQGSPSPWRPWAISSTA